MPSAGIIRPQGSGGKCGGTGYRPLGTGRGKGFLTQNGNKTGVVKTSNKKFGPGTRPGNSPTLGLKDQGRVSTAGETPAAAQPPPFPLCNCAQLRKAARAAQRRQWVTRFPPARNWHLVVCSKVNRGYFAGESKIQLP